MGPAYSLPELAGKIQFAVSIISFLGRQYNVWFWNYDYKLSCELFDVLCQTWFRVYSMFIGSKHDLIISDSWFIR